MTTLEARLNPNGEVVAGGRAPLSFLDLAGKGVAIPVAGARVAIALRDPLSLVRAIIALDGQVSALLLLSPQMPKETILRLVEVGACSHLLSDRSDLGDAQGAIGLSAMLGDHRETPAVPTRWLMTTSGTTGLPKIIPHSLASLSRTVVVRLATQPTWGMLYDGTRFAGMQVLLQALIGGRRLVLVNTEAPLAVQVAEMQAAGVTHLSATPTLWRRILMVPGQRELPLRQITLGGEIADQAILTALADAHPKARVTHIYASTETGVGFAVNDGQAGFPDSFLTEAPGGIGVKLYDNTLWLRAPTGKALAAADMPELLRDAEDFVSTGDQVEHRGRRIYFLGRATGVINIGGVKVHPERVESVIATVPGVGLVQVSSKTNPFTGALVVATVQPKPSQNTEALRAAILETCRARLEREAVPAFVKFADDLQINAAGKIIRKKSTGN